MAQKPLSAFKLTFELPRRYLSHTGLVIQCIEVVGRHHREFLPMTLETLVLRSHGSAVQGPYSIL